MRVLLVVVHPVTSIFPQGIAYVAAALKAAGHDVFGININTMPVVTSLSDLMRDRLAQAVEDWQPDALALGGLSADYPFIKLTMELWRTLSPHTPIILGGGLVTADADFIFSILKPDFAISGDAEDPIVQLADAIKTGNGFGAIPGLRYWRDGVAMATPDAARTKVMPDHPRPDYDPFDMEGFLETITSRHTRAHSGSAVKPRPFPVSAGRSCPFKCTFCFHASNALYRPRPIDDVIDEIAYFHDKYKFSVLIIYDELFSAIQSRIPEFCEKIKKLKTPIEWTCSMRVTDASTDLLRQMKDAGCVTIGYGLESASDCVLESMKKKITQADISRALDLTVDAGIAFQGNFIFGDPAETEETVDETIKFYKTRCQDQSVELGIIRPYPGTPIFQGLIDRNVITDKAAYYETVQNANHDFRANYNMTSMPDNQFWRVMHTQVGTANNRKVTTAHSIQECPKCEKPGWETRTDVLITASCPHCGNDFTKSYDIYFDAADVAAWKTIDPSIFHLCSSCKQTSTVLVSPLIAARQDAAKRVTADA